MTLKELEIFYDNVFALLKRSLNYLDSLGFVEEDNGDFFSLRDDIEEFLCVHGQLKENKKC